ncbi:MAG: flagellar hook-basal body complex protein FliE [bacterium]|nr:flagellar hook-basal body complex protein FliE [bacterium]MDW8164772.1 flagellar hook-basal body complex protein FliE [Candidatus Omnitrophota bacterium]
MEIKKIGNNTTGNLYQKSNIKKKFGEILLEEINKIDTLQKEAENSIVGFINNKKSIHEVLLILEKAEIALRVAVEMRNRLIEAYKELYRI